jgi:hypothetical protein
MYQIQKIRKHQKGRARYQHCGTSTVTPVDVATPNTRQYNGSTYNAGRHLSSYRLQLNDNMNGEANHEEADDNTAISHPSPWLLSESNRHFSKTHTVSVQYKGGGLISLWLYKENYKLRH